MSVGWVVDGLGVGLGMFGLLLGWDGMGTGIGIGRVLGWKRDKKVWVHLGL